MSNNSIDDILDQISFDDLAKESEMKVDVQKIYEQYKPIKRMPVWKKALLAVVFPALFLIATCFMSFEGTEIIFKSILLIFGTAVVIHNIYALRVLEMRDYSNSVIEYLALRKKILLVDVWFMNVLRIVGAPAAIIFFLYSVFILHPEMPWIIVGLDTIGLIFIFWMLYKASQMIQRWHKELEDI